MEERAVIGDRCTLLPRDRGSSTFHCFMQPLSLPHCCGNLATQAPVSDASRSLPSPLIALLWDGRDKGSL